MPKITIQGTIINFPDSAESPNWSNGIVEFAQAVEDALSGVVGPADVGAQVLNIDAYNPGTSVNIENLSFPISTVRAIFIRYAVYRTTDSNTVYEAGNIMSVYNGNGSIGSKWETVRDSVGDGKISFYVTDTGTVQFSTTAIAGLNHEGRLTFVAQAALQNS